MEEQLFTVVYDDLKHETDLAWLLLFDEEEVWLPKSVCEIDEVEFEIEVPEWLVEENELENYVLD